MSGRVRTSIEGLKSSHDINLEVVSRRNKGLRGLKEWKGKDVYEESKSVARNSPVSLERSVGVKETLGLSTQAIP